MKKSLKAVLISSFTVVTFLFLSIPVFAANAAEWIAPSGSTIYNNTTGVVGVLKTSKLDAEGRAFMQNFIDGKGYWLITAEGSRTRFYYWETKPSFTVSAGALFSSNFKSVEWNAITCEPSPYTYVSGLPVYVIPASSTPRNIGDTFISYQTAIDSGIQKSQLGFVWKPVRDSPTGAFMVRYDDMGSNAPDPPPTSSEPEPEPTPPQIPDFPTVGKYDNKYIVYDTTKWNGFASTIKGYIGSATNIGLVILAILVGIWIVIWIVKRFSKA